MTTRTVIEELVVALGLDPSKFNKEIKNSVVQVQELGKETEKSGSKMEAAIGKVAAKYLSLFAIIGMVKKGFTAISDTARETMELANASRHLGMSAGGLRNWQNAVELLGGKAEDATASVEGFQKSMFDLVTKGVVGGNLEMLARLGVRFQDPNGRARDYGDVAVDTSKAIQRNIANGQLSVQEGYYAAREAGFDDATATAMTGRGSMSLGEALAQARQVKPVDGDAVRKSEDVARAGIRRGQAAQRALIEGVDSGIGDVVEGVQDGLTRMLEWLMDPKRWWNRGEDVQAQAQATRAANPASMPGTGTVPDNWLTRMGVAAARVGQPPAPMSGGTVTNNTTTIGTVQVNAPNARNARDIAREIPGAIRKQNIAAADAGTR